MSADPIWKFRRMQPGEMNIDPIEAEFFSTEALGSLADALVREAIQNSLDARIGSKLRVRFTFATASGPPAALQANRYLAGLWEHLRAARSGLSMLPSPDEPLRFVAFEDFGTRGLQGDPSQTEDQEEDDGPKNDFYYFWRNVGRSQKQSTDIGRWGLGKTVFPAASRINSFFAVTVRADDARRLLMGQSVLKIHKLGNERYYPYGYFGSFERDFALPVEDPAYIDRFCRDFAIQRGDATGLSVVVPYPAAEIEPQTVIPSVIGHYFVPILAGDLTVEVAFDGKIEVIDRSTLPGLLSAASWEHGPGLSRIVDLAQWALAPSPQPHVQATPQPQASAPRWTDDYLDAKAAEGLREAFTNNRRVAVTVPVWVKPAAGDPVASRFDVFLERDDEMTGAEEVFIREGITVTGVRGSLQKGMRALVLVRDRALSQLLGDAENPAHTEWQERSPKFKEKYRHGPSVLRFVKHAARDIVRVLTRPAEGRDFKLLQHLFSLDVPTEETLKDPKKGREDKRGAEDADPAEVQTVGKDKFFQLQKLHGGFRISGNKDARGGPRYASILVAYEVRRRNPFKQYQPPDFDLERPPIQVQTRKAEVLTRKLNSMTFRIDAPDFEVTVKGFDPQRDLRVQVERRELEAA